MPAPRQAPIPPPARARRGAGPGSGRTPSAVRPAARGRWRACLAAALALGALPSAAQDPGTAGGCRPPVAAAGGPIRVDCGFGLTITIEKGAAWRLEDADRDGAPEALALDRGAALVALDPGAGREFRVVTPRAIASVRGTEWAVDAGRVETAVFVVSGRVAVSPRGPGEGVVLQRGEGVEYGASTRGRPEVERWGAPRVAALLARLGR